MLQLLLIMLKIEIICSVNTALNSYATLKTAKLKKFYKEIFLTPRSQTATKTYSLVY